MYMRPELGEVIKRYCCNCNKLTDQMRITATYNFQDRFECQTCNCSTEEKSFWKN